MTFPSLSLRGVTTTKQSIKGMTKKMSSLFDEVFITKIKGSHQKKRKALIMTSKCDIMKDILRTKKEDILMLKQNVDALTPCNYRENLWGG